MSNSVSGLVRYGTSRMTGCPSLVDHQFLAASRDFVHKHEALGLERRRTDGPLTCGLTRHWFSIMHSWVGPKNTRLYAQKRTPLGTVPQYPNEGRIPNREATAPGALLGQTQRYPR